MPSLFFSVADYPDYTLTELFVELILTQSMPLFDIGLDIGKDEKYKLQLTLPGKSQFKVEVQDWSLTEQIRRSCFNELKFIKLNKDVDLDNMHDASKLCQAKKLNNTAWNFIEDMSEFVKNKQDSIYSKDNLRKMLTMLDEIQDMRPSSFAIREAHTNRDYKLLYHTDLSNMQLRGLEVRPRQTNLQRNFQRD
ncbi:hypothetical protein NQ318_012059 [Aromia moschata]|uniref:Uncharacterized protein n=1 Tax=Aromia moschata TaxID=1265417 RepID=A0AAV8XMW1_9CUCU|nr:hypothetical protein NQ318_012059 [Aromia moschata]